MHCFRCLETGRSTVTPDTIQNRNKGKTDAMNSSKMRFSERANAINARVHAIADHRRCDEKFHLYIRLMTESSAFNSFIMLTIFLNAITIALETDEGLKAEYGPTLEALDHSFLAVYAVEFVMKVCRLMLNKQLVSKYNID